MRGVSSKEGNLNLVAERVAKWEFNIHHTRRVRRIGGHSHTRISRQHMLVQILTERLPNTGTAHTLRQTPW